MDGLHSVMRSIRGETKARRDHLSVFREFLNHLERAARESATRPRAAPRVKANGRAKHGRRNGKS
jgi:hypothetical protein